MISPRRGVILWRYRLKDGSRGNIFPREFVSGSTMIRNLELSLTEIAGGEYIGKVCRATARLGMYDDGVVSLYAQNVADADGLAEAKQGA